MPRTAATLRRPSRPSTAGGRPSRNASTKSRISAACGTGDCDPAVGNAGVGVAAAGAAGFVDWPESWPVPREWSNGPHLVRADTGRLLTGRDLEPRDDARRLFAWDSAAERLVPYDATTGRYDAAPGSLALDGEYRVATPQGEVVCHPAFELYQRLCRR